jgi:hypothetical protein
MEDKMELSRKVKASRTHVAMWFDCTHDEAVRHFGVVVMNNLVSGIGNGLTSTSNQSERISNGSNEFVTVTLTISYLQWLKLEKPLSKLIFQVVCFEHTKAMKE